MDILEAGWEGQGGEQMGWRGDWTSLKFREISKPGPPGSGLVRDLEQPLPPPVHMVNVINSSSSCFVSATVALWKVSD